MGPCRYHFRVAADREGYPRWKAGYGRNGNRLKEGADQLLYFPETLMAGDGVCMEGGAEMTTKIRADISRRNPYWLERHRYYELKHFCLQYPYWKKMYRYLDGYAARHDSSSKTPSVGDQSRPTEKIGEMLIFYSSRMELVDRIAAQTSDELADYILEAVTQGFSYEDLLARRAIPCGRDMYYTAYRRFFWLLSRERQ